MKKRAADKTAIVTGASRRIGIAAALARALAGDGWNVFTTFCRPYDASMRWGSPASEATSLVRELERLGVRAAMLESNLEEPDSATQIFDAAENQIGSVRALVNAHAYSTSGGLLDTSVGEFDWHLAVNARGVFVMSAEFARRFKGPGGV